MSACFLGITVNSSHEMSHVNCGTSVAHTLSKMSLFIQVPLNGERYTSQITACHQKWRRKVGCERYTERQLTVPHIQRQKYIILVLWCRRLLNVCEEIFLFCSSFILVQYDSNTSWTVSDIQDMKHLQGRTKKHELSAACINSDIQIKLWSSRSN